MKLISFCFWIAFKKIELTYRYKKFTVNHAWANASRQIVTSEIPTAAKLCNLCSKIQNAIWYPMQDRSQLLVLQFDYTYKTARAYLLIKMEMAMQIPFAHSKHSLSLHTHDLNCGRSEVVVAVFPRRPCRPSTSTSGARPRKRRPRNKPHYSALSVAVS